MPHRKETDEVVLTGYLRDLSEQLAEHPRVVVPFMFGDAWVMVKGVYELMQRPDIDLEASERLHRGYGSLIRQVQPTGMMKEALRRGFAGLTPEQMMRELRCLRH